MGSSELGWAPVAADLPADLPGYELLDLLNRGGQGVVFRARQRSTGQQVALKLMHHGALASDRQIVRFEREVELIARLRHPHVVRLYDSGVSRGRRFYAMDYIDGRTIDEHVILNDLRPRQIVELVVQVAEGVSYAHKNAIIHRDLKPSNILVDAEGRAYVCDFGLAAELEDSAPLTMTGQVLGTLPYLSPEQAGGLDGKADVRSDVYALAVILYHLLTDDFPYRVHGPAEQVRAAIIASDPAPIRAKLRAEEESGRALGIEEVSTELEVILAKALAKSKEQRYQSMDGFAADLRRYLAGEPIAARPPTLGQLLRRAVARHKLAASVVATAAATLAVASVLIVAALVEARTQRALGIQATELAGRSFELLLHDVEEALRPLPGGLAVRDRLLAGAAPGIAELTEMTDSLEMTELALAFRERAGDIAAEQGRVEEALAAYESCLGALGGIEDGDRRAIARLRLMSKVARLRRQDEVFIQLFAVAAQVPRDEDDTRFLIAGAHAAYAGVLCDRRQYDPAFEQFSRALEVESAETPRWRQLHASIGESVGRAQVLLGHAEEGQRRLEEALTLREELVSKFPNDVEMRQELVRACLYSGVQRRADDDLHGAVRVLERGLEAGQWLAHWDPSSRESHLHLAQICSILVAISLDQSDVQSARTAADRGVDLIEELVAGRDDAQSTRLAADALVLRGRLALAEDRCEDAYGCFAMARNLYWQLGSLDGSDRYAARENAEAAYWCGHTLVKMGESEEAIGHYRYACERLGALADGAERAPADVLDHTLMQINLAARLIADSSTDALNEAWALMCDAQMVLQFREASGDFEGLRRPLEVRLNHILHHQERWIGTRS